MGSVNLIVVSAPAGQILYGTGASVVSDAAFYRDITNATNRYGLNIGPVSGGMTGNYGLYSGSPLSGFDSSIVAAWETYGESAFFASVDSPSLYPVVVLAQTVGDVQALTSAAYAMATGSHASGTYFGAFSLAPVGATVATLTGSYLEMGNLGAGAVTDAWALQIGTTYNSGGGSIGTIYGVKVEAQGGVATNNYSFWSDEQGVLRIKSDNSFDSTYQAIIAGYNPLFPKYVAGAADYERWTIYWDGNVANFGTVKGGTGTLRPTRLIGSQIQFATAAVPSANDGAAIGSTSLQWSDLFLASGGVINWANGNVTLTHAAGLLTMAGGDLLVGGKVVVGTGAVLGSGTTLFGFKVAPASGVTAGQTVFIQDATATTGQTTVVIKAGAVGGTLLSLQNSAGTVVANITNVGDIFSAGTSGFQAAASAFFYWAGRSQVSSPADGNLKITNAGQSDFGRLQFGGTTSSFPALKRSTTTLVVRLADDSANAGLVCGAFTASGNISFFGATPVAQGASVADATGGATIDAEARTAINALISRIEATGLIATV